MRKDQYVLKDGYRRPIICRNPTRSKSYIPLDDDLKVTLDNVKKVVTPNTKVISIAHITNVVGDIRPIEEIINFAHENGIKVLEGAETFFKRSL